MGFGFCMRVKDSTINYKFDFKIDKISIYKVRDTTASKLMFYSVDTSDWTWQNGSLPVPDLLMPANGASVDSLPVNLKWSKPIDARYFAVQVSADSLFQSIVSQDSVEFRTSKYVYKLKNDRTYYWRVSANYTLGKSDWSAPYFFVVKSKRQM